MIVDLHNHTSRCNHATGTMEAYLLRAIENKTQFYGFSDHAPMNFDTQYRMSFEEMPRYFQEIHYLQQKYQDQITLLRGLEVDYLPGYMDSRVLNADVDYLIGSIHFLDKWGFDNPQYISEYEKQDINQIWIDYFQTIEDMAQTQHFDIVGHIDLIKVFKYYPSKDISTYISKSLDAIKDNNLVIELNVAGLRKKCKEIYPSVEILTMAYQKGIDITFSSDAHKVDDVGYKSLELIKAAKDVGYKQCAIFRNRTKELINF
jgi:histidinol-phosphatase (PHP family)